MERQTLFDIIEEGYKRRIKHFKAENRSYEVVLVGDSMIAFLNTRQFFPQISIMNQGISGDTTQGLYERLEFIYLVKPKKVFINIGSNDLVILKKSPEEIVNSIENITDQIENNLPEAHIFLMNVAPVNANLDISNHEFISGRKNEDIRTINRLLLESSLKDKIINIHDLVVNSNLELDKKYTTDGIHLNEEGYLIYQKLILEKL